jgi:AcrR family transcriptional regulator
MQTPGRRPLGREALLDAAAVLMDEHGIDHVSLNEINRASGNRNRSAISYHFGSRQAIVRELVARGMAAVDAERGARLDVLEQRGVEITPRMGVELVVRPLARCLDDLPGRRYLRLCGQLTSHPGYVRDTRDLLYVNDSMARCAVYAASLTARLPERVAGERIRQLIGFTVRSLADQATLVDAASAPRVPLTTDEFATNLVDVVIAMLGAGTSLGSAVDHDVPRK